MSRFLRNAKSKSKSNNENDISEPVSERPVRRQLDLLKSNIKGIVNLCKKEEQDWVLFIVGPEGVGKSTLAMHVCETFAEYSKIPFKLDDSYISSFDDRDRKGMPLKNSMLGFIERFKDSPFQCLLYDEAVSVLFSDDHATKESKFAKKSFIIKRDMCHFDILVAPSFYHIVKDIRERRVKTMLYCFREKDPITKRYIHKYAWFSSKEIARLSAMQKGREIFNEPTELMRLVKPVFVEDYPPMSESVRSEYLQFKRSFRDDFFAELAGNTKAPSEILISDIGSYESDFKSVFNVTATVSGD